MAVYSLLSFSTIGLFILTFTLIALLLRARTRRLSSAAANLPPPGPTGWPLLGCIPKIISMMVLRGMPMQDVFDEFAKDYGPVYCMTVAGKRVVVVNSFQTIKEVLHHPDMNDRPSPTGSSKKSSTKLYKGIGKCHFGYKYLSICTLALRIVASYVKVFKSKIPCHQFELQLITISGSYIALH